MDSLKSHWMYTKIRFASMIQLDLKREYLVENTGRDSSSHWSARGSEYMIYI